jgi:hypothetical protein
MPGRTDARSILVSAFFDDAALFPPARLDMETALAGHARHRGSTHGWMVARFVCPASKLDVFHGDERIPVSVVLDGGLGDLARIGEVGAVEIKLPGDAVESGVADLSAALGDAGLAGRVQAFAEIPVAGRRRDDITRAVEAVAGAPGIDAKVRCGGETQEAIPTPEELAAFLAACYDTGVAWKATAGLHHPIRGERESGLVEHGFLNLAAAEALALTNADVDGLAAALDEPGVALDAGGLWTGDGLVGPEGLAQVRQRFLSIGTCSIDEPVEDLTALGVLP